MKRATTSALPLAEKSAWPESVSTKYVATDTSRASTNFGTELPVVPVSAFRETISLSGIPNDPRFRLTLRVYGTGPSNTVRMTFAGESKIVTLRHGWVLNPYYAELSLSIPATVTSGPLNLMLESVRQTPDVSPTLIWAFITVTNNETQHITTITPQPAR